MVVLEARVEPHTIPRAAHLDGEALRILAEAGAPVAHLGRPLDGFDLVDPHGRLLLRGRPLEAPPRGLPSGVLIHQPDVEGALRDRLGALKCVEVRLGHTVTEVAETGEGVVAQGEGPSGPFRLGAALCVGCDGAASRVREAIGARLRGGRFEQPWLVVDVLLKDAEATAPMLPDRLLQIADPDGPATYVPFPDPRRRWEFKLPPDADPEAETYLDAIRARLAPYVDPEAVVVERAAVYTFHDLVATPWRRGRLVLAGDAAHQMPPFLGQGLGAGLRDAWALAPIAEAVVRGAPLSRLDAYEATRRPHVEAVVRQAVRLGRVVSMPAPFASIRDGLLRAAHRVPALHRRLLDVRG